MTLRNVFCGLLAAFGMATPAAAQVAPPPEPLNVDERGVLLSSGILVTGATDLAIGPGDHRGLTFSRQYVDSGWRIAEQPTLSGDSNSPIVSFDGRSVRFEKVGNAFRPIFEDGASLTQNGLHFTFTTSSGMVISFFSTQYQDQMMASGLGLVQTLTYPDGVQITYRHHQDIKALDRATFFYSRLAAMTSNTGFTIKLEYESDTTTSTMEWSQITRVVAFNNAVEFCHPQAFSCDMTGNWPEATYGDWKSGSLSSVTDPAGDSIHYTYDGPDGRLSAIRRPGASTDTVAFAYNGSDQISGVTTAGNTWSYTYTATTTTTTNPAGGTTITTFDSDDLITARQIQNQVTDFTYCTASDPNCPTGLLRMIELPEGQTTEYQYDARGNVIEVRNSDSNGTFADIVTSATYATSCTNPVTCNKPLTTTDAAGHVTHYTYDPTHGGVTQLELPAAGSGKPRATLITEYTTAQARYMTLSGTWTNSSDIHVLLRTRRCRTAATCSGTADEMVVEVVHPASSTPNNLLPVSATTKLGNGLYPTTSSFTYTDLGQVASVDGTLVGTEDTSYTVYDTYGRPIGSVSADPDAGGSLPRIATRITYANGLVVRQESGTSTTTDLAGFVADQRRDVEYDDYGRPVTQRHRHVTGNEQYSVRQISYDNMGLVECQALRMNAPVTTTTLPAACTQMAAGTAGPDRITRNVYDAYGRLSEVHSGVGTTLEQVTQKLWWRTHSYQNGQLWWVKDAKGYLTQYVYDSFGRPWLTYYPKPDTVHASNPTDFDGVTYDAYGRVWRYRNRAGQYFNFTLDNLGRTTAVVVPGTTTHTRDVFYDYDLFGNLTYARFDTGGAEGITNAYNGLGQLVGSSNNMDGIKRSVRYGFDQSRRRQTVHHPDNEFFIYGYDVLNRPVSVRRNGQFNLFDWTYTPEGRLDTRVGSSYGPDASYGYDAAGRLNALDYDHPTVTNDVAYSFSFNPASQLVSETRDNDLFAFGDHSSETLDYTANGLNQYAAISHGTVTTNYSYDSNGNLTSDGTTTYAYDPANRLISATTGSDTVTLRYDPLGRLYEVKDANGDIRRLYYDGFDLIVEYDGSGNVIKRYVHGLSAGDDPLVEYDGSGTTMASAQLLSTDRLGSVISVARQDGSSFAINAYDESGVPDQHNTARFQYTGQAWVPELGMYYYKARMYSPKLGRFMQTDPIGYGDGMDMYAYVGNDPVNGVDPSGLCKDDAESGGQDQDGEGGGGCGGEDGDDRIYVFAFRLPPWLFGSGSGSSGSGGGAGRPSVPNQAIVVEASRPSIPPDAYFGGDIAAVAFNANGDVVAIFVTADRQGDEDEQEGGGLWACVGDVVFNIGEGTATGMGFGLVSDLWHNRNERFAGGDTTRHRIRRSNADYLRIVGKGLLRRTPIGAGLGAVYDGWRGFMSSENC